MDRFFKAPNAGFAGDWHGDTGWALRCLELFRERGVSIVYQVGDFGVWGGQDGASYLVKLNKRLRAYDMLLVVIPGNHENYDMIERWPVNDAGFQSRTTDAPHIWYAPRGHTWLHNGAKFAALGGAFSIDKDLRMVGKSWWPQEAITPADVQTLVTNLDTLEWDNVDVFLSHEIPAGLDVGPKVFNLPPELEWESYQQRILLREAVDRAAPRTLVHGHWHKYLHNTLEGVMYDYTPYTTDVYGLDCNRFNNNIMTADVVAGTGLTDIFLIPWK